MPSKITSLFSSKTLKNSSMIFFASFFGSLVLFVSSILLAGFFGPNDFANFKIATNLFIFLPSLIEFGIGATLSKYIAQYAVSQKEKIPHLIVSMLKIRAFSYALLLALLFVFKNQIAESFFHSTAYAPLVLAGIWISGFIYFETFKQIAIGFQDFKKYSSAQFLTLFLSGALSLGLGIFFGVFWAIVGWGLSYFVGNIPTLLLAIKKISETKAKLYDTKPILVSYSLPMYSLLIPNLVGTALVPVVSLFFSKTLVGLFAFGMIFYNGAILVPNAISQVAFPQIAEAEEKKLKPKKILYSNYKTYTAIAVPLIIAAVFATGPILSIIAPNYLQGTLITEALIVTCLLQGYLLLLGSYYSATEQIKKNWIISILRNAWLFGTAFAALIFFI